MIKLLLISDDEHLINDVQSMTNITVIVTNDLDTVPQTIQVEQINYVLVDIDIATSDLSALLQEIIEQKGRVTSSVSVVVPIDRYDEVPGWITLGADDFFIKPMVLPVVEQHIRRACYGQNLSRFMSMATQEIRSPLTAIQASAYLLDRNNGRYSDTQRLERVRRLGQMAEHVMAGLMMMHNWASALETQFDFYPEQFTVGELETSINERPLYPLYTTTAAVHIATDIQSMRYDPRLPQAIHLILWNLGGHQQDTVQTIHINRRSNELTILIEQPTAKARPSDGTSSWFAAPLIDTIIAAHNGKLTIDQDDEFVRASIILPDAVIE